MRRAAALLLAALLLGGCGFGEGEERDGGAQVSVTRDFGHAELGAASTKTLREDQTVMRLMRSEFDIETRFGGRFVEAIDGLEGTGASGMRDWFFFVNGVESEIGAGEYELSPGDRVQWDYRRWDTAMRVPGDRGRVPRAVPQRHEGRAAAGAGGVRRRGVRPLPGRQGRARARRRCRRRARRWARPAPRHVTRLVVARWPRARIVRGGSTLEEGPQESGVFARFGEDGGTLELLDGDGEVARTVRPGDGTALVAALRPRADELVWLMTALDREGLAAGVRCAARGQVAQRVRRGRNRLHRREASAGRAMTLIPSYRSRPSALHTARASVGAAFCCAFALVGALYRHPLILAGAMGGILVGGDRRRRRPGGRALAAAGAAVRRCWWRRSTRSSTRRAPRCWCAAASFLGRRWDVTLEATARGPDERHADRRADRRARRPDVRRGRSRRAAQGAAPDLLPLGADRDARHAAGAGARPRRRPHGRRRALPPAPAGPPGRRARGAVRGARPRRRRGGGARGARLLAGGPARAPPPTRVAP